MPRVTPEQQLEAGRGRGKAPGPAEEPAEASAVRYRELFELAPIGYCITDTSGVIREANRALARLLGVPAATLAGRPVAAYAGSTHRRELEGRLRELREGTPQSWALELQPQQAQPVWVEAIVEPAEGDSALGELRWVVRDITEPKRAERELAARVDARTAELERSEALLEAVLRQMPGGVLVVDAARRVLVANDNARAILGDALSDGEPLAPRLARRAFRLDGSRYRPEELPLARALDAGVTTEHELLRYDRDDGGEPLTLDVAAALVRSEAGDPIAVVSVLTDVTERERVVRATREFVTNAAHELQTPIAAIVSAVDVLQAGAKTHARDRDRFLRHVEQQAGRLTRLVRTLLVLARAQSGLEEAPVETVRVRPLLETVRSEVHSAGQVAVEIECPRQLGVVANADLVEQALLNLATNAARHTATGSVRLIGHEVDDARVAIEVSDTGRGIDDAELARVFDRFYRGDGARGGFGLGLAIVREVAQALGGELEAESEVGVGTTVRLVLPGVRFQSR